MFLALRKRLEEIDRPKWAAIFVFEFIVVLLGVLTAQTLQERFQAQRERDAYEAKREAVNEQLKVSAGLALQKVFSAQCRIENLQGIIEAVDARRAPQEGEFFRITGTGTNLVTALDGEFFAQVRRFASEDDARNYLLLASMMDGFAARASEKGDLWAIVSLADNGGRPLEAGDRTAIRIAARQLIEGYGPMTRFAPVIRRGMQSVGASWSLDPMRTYFAGPGAAEPCADEVIAGVDELIEDEARRDLSEGEVPAM